MPCIRQLCSRLSSSVTNLVKIEKAASSNQSQYDMTDKVNRNTELQETNHSPWAQSVAAVLDALNVEAEQGLAGKTVRRRRKEYGKNRLRHTARRSAWQILYEQFKSLVVLLLIVAAVISLAFGEWIDAALLSHRLADVRIIDRHNSSLYLCHFEALSGRR